MRRFRFRWGSRLRGGRAHQGSAGHPVTGAWPEATQTHPALTVSPLVPAVGTASAPDVRPHAGRVRLGFADGSSVELDADSSVHDQLHSVASRLGSPAVQDRDASAD